MAKTELEKFIDFKKDPTREKRNELVEEHLYMVDILIKKYLGKGVDYDDLYQVGALALVQAVDRFDPEKGFGFSTFATPTILGEIKKYFRDKEWSLKVPRRMKEISAKVQEVQDELHLKYARKPTVREVAEATGFTEEQIIEATESAQAYNAYSLDQSFEEAGDEGDNSFLEKFTGFEEEGYGRVETEEIIGKVLREMPEQDRYIFRERFIYERSQADIAKTLGVSQMTISRAEKRIVEKFRESRRTPE